jgi:molecular chaperone GrpE
LVDKDEQIEEQEQAEGREEETVQKPEELESESGLSKAAILTPEEAEKIVQEKDECYDRLLRTAADFDNYRKRVQKEQANLIRYGAENALREMLPVIDNLQRAVESAKKHIESNAHIQEGIQLILAQMEESLSRLGVKPIETVGRPFDPNKHDALIRVYAPDVPEGVVVEEIRKGYYLHDKVLRPAQVTVATRERIG